MMDQYQVPPPPPPPACRKPTTLPAIRKERAQARDMYRKEEGGEGWTTVCQDGERERGKGGASAFKRTRPQFICSGS